MYKIDRGGGPKIVLLEYTQVCVACCMLRYIVLTTTVFHISGLPCTCPPYPEFNDFHGDLEDAEDFESSEDELSDEGIIIDLSSSDNEVD